jgi:hypothetical protein
MSARHYSIKSFFRNAPNALLARYFRERGVLTDFNFMAMKEGNPQPLFDAWLTLPPSQQTPMETEFREIFALSCEKGTKTIIDVALWHLEKEEEKKQFAEEFARLSNHHERALHCFLNYQPYWQGATRFFHADSLPQRYWRKRRNLPRVPPYTDEKSCQHLAQLIGDYFYYNEGRGRNCLVEPWLRHNDLYYFFAYPENYSQRSIEWVDAQFSPRPHNPAFEILFIYHQEEGMLDIYYKGRRETVEALQLLFAEAILRQPELPSEKDDEWIYNLNPLLHRDFSFIYEAESGIKGVAVKRLRLSTKSRPGRRTHVEAADVENDPNGVYDELERIQGYLHRYHVTQVELITTVVAEPDQPPKQLSIHITYPNYCSLGYDEWDLKLRTMLAKSGIETQASKAEAKKKIKEGK